MLFLDCILNFCNETLEKSEKHMSIRIAIFELRGADDTVDFGK